jgi:hypothetical protein
MRFRMPGRMPSVRWSYGALLLVLALLALLYGWAWWRQETAWREAYLGLSASLEALHQGALHHAGREAALRTLAAAALRLPAGTPALSLERAALARVSGLASLHAASSFGPLGVVVLVLLAGLAVLMAEFQGRMNAMPIWRRTFIGLRSWCGR